MKPQLCKHCLSPDVRKSDFRILEYLLVIVGVRPYRCNHCFERQYVIVSPLVLQLAAGFHKLDELINLLHPDLRQEYLHRRRRNRKRAVTVRRHVERRQHSNRE